MTGQLFNGSTAGGYKKCCHSHPVLKLGKGEIVGAACGSPREGYDIYIGFDYGMKFAHQPYPWEQSKDPVIEFQYHITDMCAPKSPKDFKKMIKWVAEQLNNGKKIHVGCIGGHGRTGTFLAALVSYMKVSKDPIKWVRKNHCKKAVESKSQIKFLIKHFDCKDAKPTKEGFTSFSGTPTGRRGYSQPEYQHQTGSRYRKPKPISKDNVVALDEKISCMDGRGSIWG